VYFSLFWSFFQIGLFSFGGGYASLPLIQNQVVELHGWLTLTQFTDLITISQMTPGPIAINASTFVGTRIGGVWGAVAATLGCVLPSCLIVSLLAFLYMKYNKLTLVQGILNGLRPAVVSLIASAGVGILIVALWGENGIAAGSFDYLACALILTALFILRKWRPNPIWVMAGCGVLGGVIYLLK